MFPRSQRRTNHSRASPDGSCACAACAHLRGRAGSLFPTLPPAPWPEAPAAAWESEVPPSSPDLVNFALCVRRARRVWFEYAFQLKNIVWSEPVKRHRGEPGHTRDTRAHTGTRKTQTNLTTIQTHEHTTRTSAQRPKPRTGPPVSLNRYR